MPHEKWIELSIRHKWVNRTNIPFYILSLHTEEILKIWTLQTALIVLKFELPSRNSKQGRHPSGCYTRRSIIRVFTVYSDLSVRIFGIVTGNAYRMKRKFSKVELLLLSSPAPRHHAAYLIQLPSKEAINCQVHGTKRHFVTRTTVNTA